MFRVRRSFETAAERHAQAFSAIATRLIDLSDSSTPEGQVAGGYKRAGWEAELVSTDVERSDSISAPYRAYASVDIYFLTSAQMPTKEAAQAAPYSDANMAGRELHVFELRDGRWLWVAAQKYNGELSNMILEDGLPHSYPGP